jgi:hypothetical protein
MRGTEPDATLRRHLRTEPDDDAQARRDRAYQDYTTTLSEAWKRPPGVQHPQPTRADPAARVAAVQRQGAKWRHGA